MLRIRDATLDDLPVIVDIYNQSIPGRMATADTSPVSVESRRAWFEGHSADTRPLWVAEEDGEVVGWVSFQSFYGRPAYHITAEISLYVATAWQRQGVGGTLLAEAIRRAPEFGLRTLVAYVFGHNAPSLRMLERQGFQRWGLLPGVADMDDVLRDLVILGRPVV